MYGLQGFPSTQSLLAMPSGNILRRHRELASTWWIGTVLGTVRWRQRPQAATSKRADSHLGHSQSLLTVHNFASAQSSVHLECPCKWERKMPTSSSSSVSVKRRATSSGDWQNYNQWRGGPSPRVRNTSNWNEVTLHIPRKSRQRRRRRKNRNNRSQRERRLSFEQKRRRTNVSGTE